MPAAMSPRWQPQPSAPPPSAGPQPGQSQLPPPPVPQQGPAQPPQPEPGKQLFQRLTQSLAKQGIPDSQILPALAKLKPLIDMQFNEELKSAQMQLKFQTEVANFAQKKMEELRRELDTAERQRHDKVMEANQGARINIYQQEADQKGMREKRLMSAASGSGSFSKEDVEYWAGVMENGGNLPPRLASTPGGKKLTADIMKAVTKSGVSPKEMLENQAELAGEKAGQRTLGTRTANIEMAATEADSLAKLAKEASAEVPRTEIKGANDIIQMLEKGTKNPELRRFVAANTSLVNAYARAINPQGVGTVADKEHAREMIATGFAKGDYAATVDQLMLEIAAAKKSPSTVKADMKKRFTGKDDSAPASDDPVAGAAIPAGWTVKEH
jgi:hypothetical protein